MCHLANASLADDPKQEFTTPINLAINFPPSTHWYSSKDTVGQQYRDVIALKMRLWVVGGMRCSVSLGLYALLCCWLVQLQYVHAGGQSECKTRKRDLK